MEAVIAALKWVAFHPFQIATMVLAGLCWHYHGAMVDARTDLAQTCHAVDMHKAEHCAPDVALVVTSRDAYKQQLATSETNALAARGAAESARLALADVRAELEHTQATQAAAEARAQVALRELRKARNTIAAASAREATLRASLYESDPLCHAWGFTPVCPGISDLLRHVGGEAGPATGHPGDDHKNRSHQAPAVPLPAPAG